MTISRPDGLGDIANLGITLSEAKQLLVRVQQQVVAEQANTHATFRPDCRSCGGTCHVKDWHPHRVATVLVQIVLQCESANSQPFELVGLYRSTLR